VRSIFLRRGGRSKKRTLFLWALCTPPLPPVPAHLTSLRHLFLPYVSDIFSRNREDQHRANLAGMRKNLSRRRARHRRGSGHLANIGGRQPGVSAADYAYACKTLWLTIMPAISINRGRSHPYLLTFCEDCRWRKMHLWHAVLAEKKDGGKYVSA